MKASAYPKFPERFKRELDHCKKLSGIKSNEVFAEQYSDLYGFKYDRWAIEAFYKGKREPSETEIENFSKMFGIRPEYLKGIDDYRTEEALDFSDMLKDQMESLFHKLIVSLGYSDSIMSSDDYNFTFPPNTKAFIENVKQKLECDNRSKDILLCDVTNNKYRIISQEKYSALLSEIYDYMKFKVQNFMDPSKTHPIPFIGGRMPKHKLQYLDETTNEIMENEITIPYLPEYRYYNKKTHEFESSTKGRTFTEDTKEIVSVLDKVSSEEFRANSDKYKMNLEEDYKKAIPK